MLDSFSGAAADLKKGQRTNDNILRVLAKHPRVSTWDMSENRWLWQGIADLERAGLIEKAPSDYPWCRYALTPLGIAETQRSSSEPASQMNPKSNPEQE